MNIHKSTLEFLQDLQQNNDREWFKASEERYQQARANFNGVVEEISNLLAEKDEIERVKIFRIYRDVRFSKDKTPYKGHFAAQFSRLGKYRRGGFYLHIAPQKSYIAGGFWKPTKEDLQFIRQGISSEADLLREVLLRKQIIKNFRELQGEQVKTAPRGYKKDDPNIDLLRYKQLILSKEYADKEILSSTFPKSVASDFQSMIPFFDVVRDYMLYDGNGLERD